MVLVVSVGVNFNETNAPVVAPFAGELRTMLRTLATVNVKDADVPEFPAASVQLTVHVCAPFCTLPA